MDADEIRRRGVAYAAWLAAAQRIEAARGGNDVTAAALSVLATIARAIAEGAVQGANDYRETLYKIGVPPPVRSEAKPTLTIVE